MDNNLHVQSASAIFTGVYTRTWKLKERYSGFSERIYHQISEKISFYKEWMDWNQFEKEIIVLNTLLCVVYEVLLTLTPLYKLTLRSFFPFLDFLWSFITETARFIWLAVIGSTLISTTPQFHHRLSLFFINLTFFLYI